MARRRKKRKAYSATNKKRVRESKRILSTESDDRIAAMALGEITAHDKVLDATDLNESFRYYSLKNK